MLSFIYRQKGDHCNARRNTTNTAYSCNDYRSIWSDYIAYSSSQGNLFSFFIKPKLGICLYNIDENDEIRWGRLTEGDIPTADGEVKLEHSFYPRRRFVNVIVENTGRAVASNCEVKLRLLNKTKDCQALSTEDKSLMWNDTLSNKTNIAAKYGKNSFTLAFSQEKFTHDQVKSIGTVSCGVKNKDIPIYTWIGTLRTLIAPEKHNQDALCEGSFNVHVDVMSETGQKISSHFVITVGDTWKSLTTQKNECDCPSVGI